jgi:Na+/H+ antiporter NhaD/arsenite permease-like protein
MSNIGWVIWFGAGALVVFSLVYFYFDPRARPKDSAQVTQPQPRRRHFNITFARLFGLITVAVLAAALAESKVELQLATAAFTLLGTIAGYLAGASPTVQPAPAPPADPNAPTAQQEMVL